MLFTDNCMHEKFGIEEVYFHENLSFSLLEKLSHRAVFSLDAENPVIQKYASTDIVLIFNTQNPNKNIISQFLKYLDQDKNKADYIKANTLINEEELFIAIKTKKFVLVTYRMLPKETFEPGK